MKRRVPRLTTDEEAEAFLDTDLSELDFSQFKSGRLRFDEKAPSTGKPPVVLDPQPPRTTIDKALSNRSRLSNPKKKAAE